MGCRVYGVGLWGVGCGVWGGYRVQDIGTRVLTWSMRTSLMMAQRV
jgi:hypothetical protein